MALRRTASTAIQLARRLPPPGLQRFETVGAALIEAGVDKSELIEPPRFHREQELYKVGARLLGADVRIASRLVLKVMGGKELTRREKRQLMRTVADIFRLVPMIVFLVVPFLEFLLPVALKLFPQMLPSTFEDKLKQQEKLKKRLAVKLEVAKFLQDTVAVLARDLKKKSTGETQESAGQLFQFMKDIRRGKAVDNADILRFAQLFNDELTLDNLERVHLVSMCQFVGLSPFGTNDFLRSRLRGHLGSIKRDDQVIREEGVETMTLEELRQASRARGMKTPYGEGAKQFMERQMEEWLELSLDRALPSSLLLLSRAFTVTLPPSEQKTNQQIQLESLKNTLSTLPEEALEDVNMEVVHDNQTKLEYLKREEELIREEEAEAKAQESSEDVVSPAPESSIAQQMAASTTAATIFQAAEAQTVKDALDTEESDEERALKAAAAREARLQKVLKALAVLASSSCVSDERSKFMELVKREVERIQKEMSERGGASLRFSGGGLSAWRPAEADEIPGIYVSKNLSDKVSKFLHNIEKEMDDVDKQIGENMHLIDLDGDGVISREELKTALGFLREQLGGPELENLLEELCKVAEKDSQIDVKQLMALANERLDSTNVEGST